VLPGGSFNLCGLSSPQLATNSVILAQARIQRLKPWTPAFASVTLMPRQFVTGLFILPGFHFPQFAANACSFGVANDNLILRFADA